MLLFVITRSNQQNNCMQRNQQEIKRQVSKVFTFQFQTSNFNQVENADTSATSQNFKFQVCCIFAHARQWQALSFLHKSAIN